MTYLWRCILKIGGFRWVLQPAKIEKFDLHYEKDNKNKIAFKSI